MNGLRHKNGIGLFCGIDRHGRCFDSGGRAVIEGSIGDIETGQGTDHRLKFKNSLEKTLRHLRLVWSITCVEVRQGHDSSHKCGNNVIVGAAAKEGDGIPVLSGQSFEFFVNFPFRLAVLHLHFILQQHRIGNIGKEIVDA